MYNVLVVLGILITIYCSLKEKDLMRVDLKIVEKFITIMILCTFFRFALFDLAKSLGFDILKINKGISGIDFWRLGIVFWEDAVFAISIYYLKDKWKKPKYIWLTFAIISGIYFGLGHVYQFNLAIIAGFLPYFIFYHFGKKFGFGTTMICHVLFDMFTYLCFRLLPFIIY